MVISTAQTGGGTALTGTDGGTKNRPGDNIPRGGMGESLYSGYTMISGRCAPRNDRIGYASLRFAETFQRVIKARGRAEMVLGSVSCEAFQVNRFTLTASPPRVFS